MVSSPVEIHYSKRIISPGKLEQKKLSIQMSELFLQVTWDLAVVYVFAWPRSHRKRKPRRTGNRRIFGQWDWLDDGWIRPGFFWGTGPRIGLVNGLFLVGGFNLCKRWAKMDIFPPKALNKNMYMLLRTRARNILKQRRNNTTRFQMWLWKWRNLEDI